MQIKIEEKQNRIDSYLIEELDYSRSKVQKLIKEGYIKVNGNNVKNSYKLKIDDVIDIEEYKENCDIVPQKMDLEIIYEDEDVLVVNKPNNLVVHPAAGHYSDTLVNGLMYHSKLSDINGEYRPGIVHRIDADTTGLLMVAKNNEAHVKLAEELKEKKTTRKYIALVDGVINHDTATIDAPIGRDSKDRKKMTVTSMNSKSAVTHLRVLERYENATLIELSLETGRTHQIRVHMKYIGHPVINDRVYGKTIINETGQCLHAKTLGFIHPRTNEYMQFDSNLPDCFNDILKLYKK